MKKAQLIPRGSWFESGRGDLYLGLGIVLKTFTMRNLYEILGVDRDASFAEIKEAFHREIHACHPDKCGPEFTEKAKEVIIAYETLSSVVKRLAYNRAHSIKSLLEKWNVSAQTEPEVEIHRYDKDIDWGIDNRSLRHFPELYLHQLLHRDPVDIAGLEEVVTYAGSGQDVFLPLSGKEVRGLTAKVTVDSYRFIRKRKPLFLCLAHTVQFNMYTEDFSNFLGYHNPADAVRVLLFLKEHFSAGEYKMDLALQREKDNGRVTLPWFYIKSLEIKGIDLFSQPIKRDPW